MAYAFKYWNVYSNSTFGYLSGSDCANFASQTLLARGWTRSAQWFNYGAGDWSGTWVSSTALSSWLKKRTDLATHLTYAQRDAVTVGDVVQFRWPGHSKKYTSWDHTGIVSKVVVLPNGRHDIYYTSHTRTGSTAAAPPALAAWYASQKIKGSTLRIQFFHLLQVAPRRRGILARRDPAPLRPSRDRADGSARPAPARRRDRDRAARAARPARARRAARAQRRRPRARVLPALGPAPPAGRRPIDGPSAGARAEPRTASPHVGHRSPPGAPGPVSARTARPAGRPCPPPPRRRDGDLRRRLPPSRRPHAAEPVSGRPNPSRRVPRTGRRRRDGGAHRPPTPPAAPRSARPGRRGSRHAAHPAPSRRRRAAAPETAPVDRDSAMDRLFAPLLESDRTEPLPRRARRPGDAAARRRTEPRSARRRAPVVDRGPSSVVGGQLPKLVELTPPLTPLG